MVETGLNPRVDAYLKEVKRWREELARLRAIVLECGLREEVKWGAPCYTHEGANVVILGEMKDCCVLTFCKGVLLKDPEGLLIRRGEHTQVARVIRFTEVREIANLAPVLKDYIRGAIEVERAGVKVELAREPEPVPEELEAKFKELPEFRAAFAALTPGRQRAYLLHFAAPKQSSTRASRIEKYRARIMTGKGLNDCVCGLSRKMPSCDGSHQSLKGASLP